jgi:hypothetical protein
MKLAIICVILVASLAACTTPESRQRAEISRHRQYLEDQARVITVDATDGISEVEAYKIALDRFNAYRIACGDFSTPVDLGDYWRVTMYSGYAAIPFEEILIRKSDGQTTITKLKFPNLPDQHPQPTPR